MIFAWIFRTGDFENVRCMRLAAGTAWWRRAQELALLQFHFHSPSEHTVGGRYFDAEAHFVFVDAAGAPRAVIGVLLQADSSADNGFLADFWGHFDDEHHEHPGAGIDPVGRFFPKVASSHSDQPPTLGAYWRYSGSLTTPGCGEGVLWTVMTQPAHISVTQLAQYKAALTRLPQTQISLTNNRPIQPTNGRPVQLVTDLGYSYDASGVHAPAPLQWNTSFSDCGGCRFSSNFCDCSCLE